MTAKLLLAPLMLIIRLYQWCVSPLTAAQCRYHPTCSAYAAEAVETHGVYGVWLTLKRLARCHPWGGHGFDPVPQRKLERTPHATSTK